MAGFKNSCLRPRRRPAGGDLPAGRPGCLRSKSSPVFGGGRPAGHCQPAGSRRAGARFYFAGGDNRPSGVTFLGDHSLATVRNFSAGDNQPGADLLGVNLGRDFSFEELHDFAEIQEGFLDEKGQPIQLKTAAEVGNIFDLGTKFSRAFGLAFASEAGGQLPPQMGCYGIGVSRLVAVAAEVFADEKGIAWPAAIAPALVHVVALPGGQAAPSSYAVAAAGIESIVDDRDARAGEKLADAELIGTRCEC